jgi:cytochrome d ubiquinol oxidase subunit II
MATKAREGWAFIGTFAAIAFAVVAYFGALFPNAMPSTLGDAQLADSRSRHRARRRR